MKLMGEIFAIGIIFGFAFSIGVDIYKFMSEQMPKFWLYVFTKIK